MAFYLENPEERYYLRDQATSRNINIKLDAKELWCEVTDWIQLA
jgi:hypothetical protein